MAQAPSPARTCPATSRQPHSDFRRRPTALQPFPQGPEALTPLARLPPPRVGVVTPKPATETGSSGSRPRADRPRLRPEAIDLLPTAEAGGLRGRVPASGLSTRMVRGPTRPGRAAHRQSRKTLPSLSGSDQSDQRSSPSRRSLRPAARAAVRALSPIRSGPTRPGRAAHRQSRKTPPSGQARRSLRDSLSRTWCGRGVAHLCGRGVAHLCGRGCAAPASKPTTDAVGLTRQQDYQARVGGSGSDRSGAAAWRR
jgi:hypothetical protein